MTLESGTMGLPQRMSGDFHNIIGNASCTTDLISAADGMPRIKSCHNVQLGCISLVKFDLSGVIESKRTSRHVQADRMDEFLVAIPLYSDVRLCQSGISSQMLPGTFSFLATSRPFEAFMSGVKKQDDPFSELLIKIPGPVLRQRMPTVDDICGLPLDIKSGAGNIMKTLLELALSENQRLRHHQTRRLGDMVIDAVINAATDIWGHPIRSQRASARARIDERAALFIESNLSNPGLSSEIVAEHCHVSSRYLRAVFAAQNTSVSSLIRELRLQRCREDLSNPALTHRSITAIAMTWGFSDMAYFSRAFRARFGQAPSATRAPAHHGIE